MVVVGAVVGATYVVVGVVPLLDAELPELRVVVGVVDLVVEPDAPAVVPLEGAAVVGVVAVLEEAPVLVDPVEVEPVGAGTITVVVVLAAPATRVTKRAEATPEPSRTLWLMRRIRLKRRSRCWGVRNWGVMKTVCQRFLRREPARHKKIARI